MIPPKPRFLPERARDQDPLRVWGPRAGAIGFLAVVAFILLRLFAG